MLRAISDKIRDVIFIILLFVYASIFASSVGAAENADTEWFRVFGSDIEIENITNQRKTIFAELDGDTLYKMTGDNGSIAWLFGGRSISNFNYSKEFDQSENLIYLESGAFGGRELIALNNSDGKENYSINVNGDVRRYDGTKNSLAVDDRDFAGAGRQLQIFESSDGSELGPTRNRTLVETAQELVFGTNFENGSDDLLLSAYPDDGSDSKWNNTVQNFDGGVSDEENFYFGVKETSSSDGFKDVVKTDKMSGDETEILSGNASDTFDEIDDEGEENGILYLMKEDSTGNPMQIAALSTDGGGILWRYNNDKIETNFPKQFGDHLLLRLDSNSGADKLLSLNTNDGSENWKFQLTVLEDFVIEGDPSESKAYLEDIDSGGDTFIRVDHSSGTIAWYKAYPQGEAEEEITRDQFIVAPDDDNDTRILSFNADSGDTEWMFHLSDIRDNLNDRLEDIVVTFQCNNSDADQCSDLDWNLGPRFYVEAEDAGGNHIAAAVESPITNNQNQFKLEGDGCIIQNMDYMGSDSPILNSLRQIRDWILSITLGRYLITTYYSWLGHLK